jgi:hypothetical protein
MIFQGEAKMVGIKTQIYRRSEKSRRSWRVRTKRSSTLPGPGGDGGTFGDSSGGGGGLLGP